MPETYRPLLDWGWLKVERLYDGYGPHFYIECGPFAWDFQNWSVSRRISPCEWIELFAFRCAICRRWSWGCHEHWLCSLCPRCKARIDAEDD